MGRFLADQARQLPRRPLLIGWTRIDPNDFARQCSWNLPTFAAAIVLIGGIQHRLAGLGHEAAHYAFLKNRFLNDLIPDLFCMFPLLTTVAFYRLFHMAHHQFTNDPDRDPDLLNMGDGTRAREFPMTRRRFIRVVYFCFLVAPIRFVRYQWAYLLVNTFGQGKNIYQEQTSSECLVGASMPRLATMLGLVYLFSINAVFWLLTWAKQPNWIVRVGFMGTALAAVTIYRLPGWAVFRSPLRAVYSIRFSSVVRIGYYILPGHAHPTSPFPGGSTLSSPPVARAIET